MDLRRSAVAALAIPTLAACANRCPCETRGLPRLERVALAASPQILLEGTVLLVPGRGAEADGVRTVSTAEAEGFAATQRDRWHATVLALPAVLSLDGQESSLFVGEFPESSLRFVAPDSPDRFDAPGVHGLGLWTTAHVADGGAVSFSARLASKPEAAASGRATRLTAATTLAPGSSMIAEAPLDASDPKAPGRLVLILSARVIPAAKVAAK